jgi:hypothetical protein
MAPEVDPERLVAETRDKQPEKKQKGEREDMELDLDDQERQVPAQGLLASPPATHTATSPPTASAGALPAVPPGGVAALRDRLGPAGPELLKGAAVRRPSGRSPQLPEELGALAAPPRFAGALLLRLHQRRCLLRASRPAGPLVPTVGGCCRVAADPWPKGRGAPALPLRRVRYWRCARLAPPRGDCRVASLPRRRGRVRVSRTSWRLSSTPSRPPPHPQEAGGCCRVAAALRRPGWVRRLS